MKRILNFYDIPNYLLILLLVLSVNIQGQIVFESGYFINNDDKKTDCLIKNYEWENSPTQVEYKLTDSSTTEISDISNIKEFMVAKLKYRRFTVEIDQSSSVLSSLSDESEPIFIEKTLFLRVLIEGNANLYEAGYSKRYFYNVGESKVIQLIYKEYKVDYTVATNNTFKSQLWKDLNCSCISFTDIKNIEYKKSYLLKIFERYNTCINSDFVNFEYKEKRDLFYLTIKPGIRYSSLSIRNSYNKSQNIDYENKLSFSFGLETEFVFPFNKNKWALFLEPTLFHNIWI